MSVAHCANPKRVKRAKLGINGVSVNYFYASLNLSCPAAPASSLMVFRCRLSSAVTIGRPDSLVKMLSELPLQAG